MPHRVDPMVDRVEPSRLDRVSDRFLRIPELGELSQRNNPVLPNGQPRQLMVTSSFPVHTDY